jgi:hypothetical protein
MNRRSVLSMASLRRGSASGVVTVAIRTLSASMPVGDEAESWRRYDTKLPASSSPIV